MRCWSCKKPPDKGRDIFTCDICKEQQCKECCGLTSSEVKVMELKSRVMILACSKCQKQSHYESFHEMLRAIEQTMIGEFKNLQTVIEMQNKKISEQDEVINKILKKTNLSDAGSSRTYANIAAVKNTEVIVIKPRDGQDSDVTKNDLKEKIDPKGLAIGVENMRRGKGGAVIIDCTNSVAKQKIKQKVESDFGNKYSVADGIQKNPKIIIRGVEEEYIDNEDSAIIECIKQQNDLHIDESTIIEVQRKYKQKDKVDKGNIVLTVDVSLKERICELGRVNIGWRRCMAQEFFSVMRCFKCARYGHTAQKCQNRVTCFNCGGTHKSNDCPDPGNVNCINCTETNKRLKKALITNHTVFDPECPCYKRLLELEAKKTKRA